MSLKQTIRQLNWRRKFYQKLLTMYPRYFLYQILNAILPKRKAHFDLSKIKKILLIRNDRIGDMVVTTPMIRHLSNAGYEVYVSSSSGALDVVRYNPHVSGVFVYNQKNLIDKIKALIQIRKEQFDLAIECRPFHYSEVRNFDFFYYSLLPTTHLMGIHRHQINAYNINYEHRFTNEHVTEQLNLHLNHLGIAYPDNHYELFTSDNIENHAETYFPSKPYIVINPFGSTKHREMSTEQIQQTASNCLKKGYEVILVGLAKKLAEFKQEGIHIYPSRTVMDIVPIIRDAVHIITVDTSVIHFAAAFAKPTTALYLEPSKQIDCQAPEALKELLNQEIKRKEKNLIDRVFGKDAHCSHNLPDNSVYWVPNNPNAQQIIFQNKSFSSIEDEDFNSALSQALDKIETLKLKHLT